MKLSGSISLLDMSILYAHSVIFFIDFHNCTSVTRKTPETTGVNFITIQAKNSKTLGNSRIVES